MLEELIKEIVKETVKSTLIQLSATKQELNSGTMDTKQLSEYINMSTAWIYQNLDTLPYYKIGKKLVFSRLEINTYMKQRKEEKESNKTQNKSNATKIKGSKCKVV